MYLLQNILNEKKTDFEYSNYYAYLHVIFIL